MDPFWQITVGGTGRDGNFKTQSDLDDPGWEPNTGYGMNIAAPATDSLIWTTTLGGPGSLYGNEGSFNGTSAACPHVTAVATLLYSYMNDTGYAYKNLAPEDIRYIIDYSAFPTDTPGYNLLTGYGRLNAGGALSIVDTSKRKFHHFDSDSLAYSTSISQINIHVSTLLNQQAKNASGYLFQAGSYLADIYKVSCIMSLPLLSTDTIRAYWERHSSSNTYPYLGIDSSLLPHERIIIDSINTSSARVSGYIYHLFKQSGASVGWLPFDTTNALTTNFAISVLTGDSILKPWDTTVNSVLSINDSNFKVKVYPNPMSNNQIIEMQFEKPDQQISVGLYDFEGRLIKTVYNGMVTEDRVKFVVNLYNIESGSYFYSFSCSGLPNKYIKIVKF